MRSSALALITLAGLSCREPATATWRAPAPVAPAETPEQAMRRVFQEAADEREGAYLEAMQPGARAARLRATLAAGTLDAFRSVGEELFHLDTPWRGGDAAPVFPIHGGASRPDATRCIGCHRMGGPGGSGTHGDLAFFAPEGGGDGDDALVARPFLPPMLAGAALLELAAREDREREPFGWRGGRPRRLREMVRWSIDTHLGERAGDAEVDAITTWIALVPPPAPVLPEDDSLAARTRRGGELFVQSGCATCHVPSLPVTDPILHLAGGRRLDLSAQLSADGRPPFAVHAYSDLRVHAMGEALAVDGDDRFVTAPLWGIASRPLLLHDGRAGRISEAILAHGGEAAAARDAYEKLAFDGSARELDLFLLTLSRAPALHRLR